MPKKPRDRSPKRRRAGRTSAGEPGAGETGTDDRAAPSGPEAPFDPNDPALEGHGVTEPDEPRASDDGEAGGTIAVDDIKELATELELVRDRHLRLAAEFDNFRKRTMRERALQAERAQADLVKELLESLDDLSRVLQMGASAQDTKSLLEGVQLVERKLRRALENSGLKQIEAVGQPFNPELHEALATVPADQPKEDGIVAEELAKGYVFGDTLLKPALVNVMKYEPRGKGVGGSESTDAEQES